MTYIIYKGRNTDTPSIVHTHKTSRLGQQHNLQNTTFDFLFL
jgi:hypothetical protein